MSEEETDLLTGISNKGIVKICGICNMQEDLPLIKKADDFKLKEAEKSKGVYERLSRYAKVDPVEHQRRFRVSEKIPLTGNQDKSLRELVDKNLKTRIAEKKVPRTDLVDNFHWLIMRARRSTKLTQAQFAKEIGEPETYIKMVEEGVVPDGNITLIPKIERYLNITIRKLPEIYYEFSSPKLPEPEIVDTHKKEVREQFLRDFNINSAKELKISDLKVKEQKPGEREDSYKLVNASEFPDPFEKSHVKKKEDNEERELTNEEVERILYGDY
jgi:ribosome-binding protein aMBF1 (putative translation factor)